MRPNERGDVVNTPEDATLVAGTSEDFAQLFDRHASTLHRYCARRVGPESAEDVVAETFLLAYERRRRFTPDVSPRAGSALPWLYGIATNVLRRHRRDEVRAFRAYAKTGLDPLLAAETDASEGVIERVDAVDDLSRVMDVLARMPIRQREVLLLSAWEGLSYSEIASALGISLGTVASRLSRARTKLHDAFAQISESYFSHEYVGDST